MATVNAHCPYCGFSERLSIYEPIGSWPVDARRDWYKGPKSKAQHGAFILAHEAVSPVFCHNCGGYAIGLFLVEHQHGLAILKSGYAAAIGIEGLGAARLLALFPAAAAISAPTSVPAKARRFFIEANEDLRNGRDPAGIISKCRSVLDLCLKELNAKGDGRKARIANLREQGILTFGIAQWAERLWDDGNDAIHDLEGSEENARLHIRFLDVFFEVAFVLPAQVAAAQEGAVPGPGAK